MIVGNRQNRKTIFAIYARDGGMPKTKNKPKLTDTERHARFVDMAHKVGASDDPKDFDKAFKKIARARPQSKPKA